VVYVMNNIPFWTNDPTILLNKEYIFELYPDSSMSYEQKMNAITRIIILLTLLGYFITRNIRILIVGVLTLAAIAFMFKPKLTKDHEGFRTMPEDPILKSVLKSEFKKGCKKNPFSNVLLTQIMDEPDRDPAPPAFNPVVDEDITKQVKKTVQLLNPGIKNTNKQLYGDLWQKFELDQSNRAFFSTANTRIENDQTAFSNFLYGNMPSSKESNSAAAMQRVADTQRYTLY
jgi:hypothetical protein